MQVLTNMKIDVILDIAIDIVVSVIIGDGIRNRLLKLMEKLYNPN